MKNNKTIKNNIAEDKLNGSHLNILKAQLRNKLQEIGIIFNETPKQIQTYKNCVAKERSHKKYEILPNMQTLKNKQFLNDQFKDKLEPKYPEIFSYRANRVTKINNQQPQKQKTKINSSLEKLDISSPHSFRDCFRSKIIQDARIHKIESQTLAIAKALSKQKLIFSGMQQNSMIIKKIKDLGIKNQQQYDEINEFKQELKKINLKIRSKTQQNKDKYSCIQGKTEKKRKLKNTFYRDISPWNHNKLLERQQQFF